MEVEVEMTAMEAEEEEGGGEGKGREAEEEASAVVAAAEDSVSIPLCGSALMAHSMLSLLCSRLTMASTGNESPGVGSTEVRMGAGRERVGVEEREEERDATRDGTPFIISRSLRSSRHRPGHASLASDGTGGAGTMKRGIYADLFV